MSHNATGPEPDYVPSQGPTMVNIPLVEYESLRMRLHEVVELRAAFVDMRDLLDKISETLKKIRY